MQAHTLEDTFLLRFSNEIERNCIDAVYYL